MPGPAGHASEMAGKLGHATGIGDTEQVEGGKNRVFGI
jgi:hypothetical protein